MICLLLYLYVMLNKNLKSCKMLRNHQRAIKHSKAEYTKRRKSKQKCKSTVCCKIEKYVYD